MLKKIPAQQLTILTRSPEKANDLQAKGINVRIGDYTDKPSLMNAMTGIDQVVLISAGDKGDRMQEHRNVVDTAKHSGVQCIAYTSRALRDPGTLVNSLMLDHVNTERYIQDSGLPYVIFRNALYMDVVPLFVGKQVLDQGIHLPAGDGKVAFALRQEQGEAMAKVLSEGDFSSRTYTFTGSEACSFFDVAAALSRLSGREVAYHPLDSDAFRERMRPTGVPGAAVEKIIAFNTDIKNDQESQVTSDLEVALGRKPMNLVDGLKLLFKL